MIFFIKFKKLKILMKMNEFFEKFKKIKNLMKMNEF